MHNKPRLARFVSAIVAPLSLALLVAPASAQYYWDTNAGSGGSGNLGGTWNSGTNWSTDVAGGIATIGWTDGNAAVFSAGIDGIGTLGIGVTGTVSPTTILTEEGIVNLTSGTISPTAGGNSVIIRGGSTLRISGAALTTSSTGVVYVGDTTAGTLDMVSGTLSAQRIDVGNPSNGPGFVTQTGGTINLTGGGGLPGLRLSHWPGSGRTYNMSGGVLNATASTAVLAIGWDGSASMTVNGTADVNAHTVQIQRSSSLSIGGSATFDVSSSMKVGDDRGAGTLNIQDSAIVNINGFSIGDDTDDAGTVNQSGGTVTVTGLFQHGHWGNETSNYNISAGTLSLTGTPGAVINQAAAAEQNGVLYLGVDGTGNMSVSGTAAVNAQAIVLDARGNTTTPGTGIDTFTLTGGTVTLTSTTAFGNGIRTGSLDANTSYKINLGGGTLAAGGSSSWSSPLLMELTGTGGNVTFNTNANGITLNKSTAGAQLTGAGGFNKTGTGTLTITSSDNSFTGNVNVNQGTLLLSGAANSHPLGSSPAHTITIAAGATLTANAGTHNPFGTTTQVPLVVVNGTMNTADFQHMQNIDMTAGLIQPTSAGTQGDGLDMYSNPTIHTFMAGTSSTITSKMTLRSNLNFLVDNGAAAIDLLMNGNIVNGGGSVNKNGAGRMTLSGTGFTYTDATNVNAGILELRDMGNASGNGFRSNIVNNAEVWLTATTGQISDHRANISGAGSLVKKDAGRVRIGTFSGLPALTYSGTTTVEAGILDLQGQAAGRGFDTTGGLIINGGAEFQLTGLAAQSAPNAAQFGALSGSGTVRGTFGTPFLEIGNGGGSGTFSGLITNNAGVPLSLIKSGAGTQVLSGNNTYTGTTTLTTTVASTANELIVNGVTSGQGNYIINSGARLGGDGTIGLATGGNVFISGTPGDLSPGDKGSMPSVTMPSGSRVASFSYSAGLDAQTVGTLTILGDVDLDGFLIIDLISPTSHDVLNVSEDFIIDAGADLEINGETDFTQLDFFGDLGFGYGDRVDLVNAGAIFGSFPANQSFDDAAGHLIFFGNDGSSIFLQAVPEPASIALWSLIGLVAVGGAWRRSRPRRA